MKWFDDLSMRGKLMVSFGLMLVLLAIIFVTAYKNLSDIQSTQKRIFEVAIANVSDLKDVRFYQDRIRLISLTMLAVKDRQRLESLKSEGDEFARKNEETIRRILEREKDSKLAARLEEFNEIRKAFRATRETQVMPLIFEGKTEKARSIITGTQAERNEKMGIIITELVSRAESEAKAVVAESSQTVNRAIYALTLAGIAALILGVLAVRYLDRLIAGPLTEIARTAEKIAAGDLSIAMPAGSRADEVGVLVQTFTRMIENMREVNRELQSSVNVLASSASEILSSTTEVASSVTETASAVVETTTTIEEVKQTALVVSKKAQYVSDASQKAVTVSQNGSRAVDDTVDKMSQIRRQMESVAESIMRLSEQSQAIGEIIATVNDLAGQSNLLAVNASIEASKAGEHGKGFAVVAQEVRSLAEQSKQATAQVRSLLNDIQKATSDAVLATEQGSKTVEEGVRQSTQAGEAIKALAASVTEAAQAATQIAASSQQQLVGMEQVISAMTSIKLASDQNVTGTRQTESAAHNIHELGQKLKLLVARYKV